MDEVIVNFFKTAYEQSDVYPKVIANFMFRQIIEDAHVKYNISQEDVKQMCKEAVNRAKALLAIQDDRRLYRAFAIEAINGIEWDDPEITDKLKERMEFYKDLAKKLKEKGFL